MARARRRTSEPSDEAAKAGMRLSEARAAKLRGIITGIEDIDVQRRELAREKSEIMRQAAEDDFDRRAIKEVLRKRKLGAGKQAELDEVVAQYELALGMLPIEQEIARSIEVTASSPFAGQA